MLLRRESETRYYGVHAQDGPVRSAHTSPVLGGIGFGQRWADGRACRWSQLGYSREAFAVSPGRDRPDAPPARISAARGTSGRNISSLLPAITQPLMGHVRTPRGLDVWQLAE